MLILSTRRDLGNTEPASCTSSVNELGMVAAEAKIVALLSLALDSFVVIHKQMGLIFSLFFGVGLTMVVGLVVVGRCNYDFDSVGPVATPLDQPHRALLQ